MSPVPFSRWTSTASLTIGALLVLHAPAPRHRTPPPIDPILYRGLAWRNIGPFRGGRIAAVTGVIGQPGAFYIGLPAGGVWKTTSAGETWYPVFDSIKTVSSVGAIEVAPSDPNVIYVGTGEMPTGSASTSPSTPGERGSTSASIRRRRSRRCSSIRTIRIW